MKKIFILIGIVMMFVLNCVALNANTEGKNVYALSETSWELSKIQQKGKNLLFPKEADITINFSKDEINGRSAVNSYFGNYVIKNNVLHSSNIASTLMAGSQKLMDIERKFFDILQSSPKVSYDKETLTLSGKKGEIWIFKVITLEKKLQNTNWQLVNMAGKDMEIKNLQNEGKITLSFKENRISGNSGINNYFGNYEIMDDNINIGTVGSTEMAGPENLMKIEREYLALLENSTKIRMTDQTTLILTTNKGEILKFKKL